MHIGNSCACIEIVSSSGTLRLASVYLRPSIPDYFAAVDECFKTLSSPYAVLGVDSNAKNQMWNSLHTDQKGLDFEQLVLINNLNVLNVPIDSLEFVPGGTSFVDVTLAGDRVSLIRWLFLPFASLSDHPFIYFELENNCVPAFSPSTKVVRPVPRFSNINQQVFLRLLEKNLSLSPTAPSLPSVASVEAEIDLLTRFICDCAKAAKVRQAETPNAKNMPWWSTNLCSLRTKARRAYKAWSKEKNEGNHTLYYLSKSTYQRELRLAKLKSWDEFRAPTSSLLIFPIYFLPIFAPSKLRLPGH